MEGVYAYRHRFPIARRGWCRLNLAWDDITCKSIVFASASEYPADERTIPEDYLCNHYGDARYTIHNITTYDGGVSVRLHVDWDSPLGISVDYLVINGAV
jgi:hypothetical protein